MPLFGHWDSLGQPGDHLSLMVPCQLGLGGSSRAGRKLRSLQAGTQRRGVELDGHRVPSSLGWRDLGMGEGLVAWDKSCPCVEEQSDLGSRLSGAGQRHWSPVPGTFWAFL